MNNKQFIEELLIEKDPETLFKKVINTDPKILSHLVKSDEFLSYVSKMMKDFPEIKNKVQKEVDKTQEERNEAWARKNLGEQEPT